MLLKAIRLMGKASVIVSAAKTGYSLYQTGTTAYKSYKKVKTVRSNAGNILKEVKRALKK